MHRTFINIIDTAKLRDKSKKGNGVCHGIVITLLLSIFSNNFEACEETIDAAENHFHGLSTANIKARLKKFESGLNKKDYFNIIAVLSSIIICHNPIDFQDNIFPPDPDLALQNNSVNLVSKFFLFQSNKLEKYTYNMLSLKGFSSIYTENDLIYFFNTVGQKIVDQKTLAGFRILYIGHTVGCAYRPEKKHWVLISNQHKIRSQHTNLTELATEAWKDLHFSQQNYRALYIIPIVTEQNSNWIESFVNAFKASQSFLIPTFNSIKLCELYAVAANFQDDEAINYIEQHKGISLSLNSEVENFQLLLGIQNDTIIYEAITNHWDDIAVRLAHLCPLKVLDTLDSNDESLLLCALKNKKQLVAEEILGRTALRISMQDKRGNTALFYALENGYWETARRIFEKSPQSASVNTQYGRHQNHWTVLDYAVRNGLYDLTGMLIATGADINAIDHRGMTLLHLALLYHHTDIAALLLKNKIMNVLERNAEGKTAIDIARENGDLEKFPTLEKFVRYEALKKLPIYNHLHALHGDSIEFISKMFQPLAVTSKVAIPVSLRAGDPIAINIVSECNKNPSTTDMLHFLKMKLIEADEAALKGDNTFYLRTETAVRILYCIDLLEKPSHQFRISAGPKPFG